MVEIRKRHSPALKLKVATAALTGDKTVAEIASKHRVHPTQVGQWKRQLQERANELFGGRKPQSEASETLVTQLY